VIIALGRVAHDATLRALRLRPRDFPFAHGMIHEPASAPAIVDSYHCSRYNTQTGRLTEAMFNAVIARARQLLQKA
jgi:uracil-DNA glycosylase